MPMAMVRCAWPRLGLKLDLPSIPAGGSAGIDIRDAKTTIGAHSTIGTY